MALIALGCAHVRPVRTGAVPAFLKQYLPSVVCERMLTPGVGLGDLPLRRLFSHDVSIVVY